MPRLLKTVCELAFLEFDVSPVADPEMRQTLRETLRLTGTSAFLHLFRCNLDHANLFVPLCRAAMMAGAVDGAMRRDFGRLVSLAARWRKERLPFRQLDLLHALYRITEDERWYRQLGRAARMGCASGGGFGLSPADDYALTHTIFYLTDFGRKKWPESIAPKKRVVNLVNALSSLARRDQNLDLLAEYALCRLFLGRQDGPPLGGEIDLLLEAQRPSGFWPGPADMTEQLRSEGIGTGEMEFFQNYHTTILGREACCRAAGLTGDTSTPGALAPLNLAAAEEPFRLRGVAEGGDLGSLVLAFDSLRQRVRDGPARDGLVAPAPEVFLNPATIPLGYEWLFWAGQAGVPFSQYAELRSMLQTMASVDPAPHEANAGFVRIWSLAQAALDAGDRSEARGRFLADAWRARLQRATLAEVWKRRELLEGLVALKILTDLPGGAASRPARADAFGHQILDCAVMEGQPLIFLELAPFVWCEAGRERSADWSAFFDSMVAETSGFGYPRSGRLVTEETTVQIRCLVFEIARAIALGHRKAREAAASGPALPPATNPVPAA